MSTPKASKGVAVYYRKVDIMTSSKQMISYFFYMIIDLKIWDTFFSEHDTRANRKGGREIKEGGLKFLFSYSKRGVAAFSCSKGNFLIQICQIFSGEKHPDLG